MKVTVERGAVMRAGEDARVDVSARADGGVDLAIVTADRTVRVAFALGEARDLGATLLMAQGGAMLMQEHRAKSPIVVPPKNGVSQ